MGEVEGGGGVGGGGAGSGCTGKNINHHLR